MKRKFNKSLTLVMALTLALSTAGSVVCASDNDYNSSTIGSIANKEYIYGTTYPNGTNLLDQQNCDKVVTIKDSTFDGIVDEKGNINVPSKEEMKERYLKKFNTDPQKYKDSITSIDSIVDKTINVIKTAKTKKFSSAANTNLSSSDYSINGILGASYWHISPYITSATNGINYSETWVGYDNYRSSVKTKCTYSKDSSTSKTIGFTGDTEIKGTFGFSATYSETQTASVTTETDVPAWTIWDTRPYITWTENHYFGVWEVESYNPLTGNTTYTTTSKYGTNTVKRVGNNEAWTATNDSHNRNATSPLPPTGTPNVDW